MNVTEILSDEHKNILKVIDGLTIEVDELKKGKEIDKEFFTKTIDFIRNYADKFHHAKEEDILFKEFNKAAEDGCVHCNPVEQMLFEHEEGRKFVKAMEQGVNENDKKKVIENALSYCNLLKDHIFKEDNILYPMSEDALSKEKIDFILDRFKDVDIKKKSDKKKYLAFVRSLRT
tara:strand:- start:60 stop:584 length:525 start_codon:yes stop_codon:yes gene_type:complete